MVTSLQDAKRITIKVGSALICDPKTGLFNKTWLCALADDIAALRKAGKEVVITSSGAVAMGRGMVGAGKGDLSLRTRQATAACGQPVLHMAWQDALQHHGIVCGQNLLTAEDSENRRRYVNARNTINAMLERDIIPIVNENDTVTTHQIRYGDNDRLAARIASMADSDVLVLLSDIDGLYTADPKSDPAAEFISQVDTISPEIMAMGGEAASAQSSGGMRTKLIAAEMCTASGCSMVIALGKVLHPLKAIQEGARCTWFPAAENPLSARKHWLSASQHMEGTLIVDDGAAKALLKGSSLLAAGITECQGSFNKGDTLWIKTTDGSELAKGITSYDAADIKMILGLKSEEVMTVLGVDVPDPVIHRDDMVLEPQYA